MPARDTVILHCCGLLLEHYPRLTPIRLKALLDTYMDPGESVSLAIASRLSGASKSALIRAIASGWLPAFKVGSYWRLPMASLDLWRMSRYNSPAGSKVGGRQAGGEQPPASIPENVE